MVLGDSRTGLVGPSVGRAFALSPKTQACLVDRLQTLARIAIECIPLAVMLSEAKHRWGVIC